MESEVRTLVNEYIEQFGISKGYEVLWPNVEPGPQYRDNPKQSADEKYTHMIVRFFPVPPEVLHPCNGSGISTWILQVTVKIRDSIGELVATRLVDELRELLPVTTEFVGVNHCYRVVKPADPRPPFMTAGWYAIPVRFRINTFN